MAETSAAGTGSTSLNLVRRLQAQDRDAWPMVVRIYGPLVYRWCRRAGLTPHDAEDVSQIVFQAVAGKIAEFRRDRPGQTFRGWLYGITRFKILDHFRQRNRQPAAPGGSDFQQHLTLIADREGHADSSLPDEDPQSSDDRRRVLHATLEAIRGEFTPHNWQAFWLTAVEEYSIADAAEQLGLPPASVRQARFRVLRRLRRELEE